MAELLNQILKPKSNLITENINKNNNASSNTNQVTTKPNIYYTTNPNFKPSDPNAVTIYIDKTGKTTGQTTAGNIPSGINVRGTTKEGENVGQVIANQIKQNLPITVYKNQFGQTISYQSPDERISNKVVEAIKSGDLGGVSSRVYSDMDIAKAQFLNRITGAKVPEQYQESLKGLTPKGIEVLKEVNRNLPLMEQTPKVFIVPEKYNYPLSLESGQAEPLLNVGSPVSIENLESFKKSYLENVKTSSTENAIEIATIMSLPITSIPLQAKAGILASPVVGSAYNYIDTNFLPQPKTPVGRFGKSVVIGIAVGEQPFLLGAFSKQIADEVIKNPVGTATNLFYNNLPETLGFAVGGGIGKNLQFKIKDIYATRGLTKLPQAELNTEPFLRNEQVVFMKRFEGVKLQEPSSFINYLKGYKKGQFLERQYRIITPEVQAYYEGLKEVSYFKPIIEKDKIIGFQRVIESSKHFPTDEAKMFKDYFETLNKKIYGLPRSSELPAELRNKPFGYSATAVGSKIKEIGEAGQFYSGKGVSVGFLRIGKDYKLISFEKELKLGNKPYIYASYGKEALVVPEAYEIKVPNPYEKGGKSIKKYIFPNIEKEAGKFYIPTNKPEVQAVAYGDILKVAKRFYVKVAGRRVPIQENIIVGDELAKELTKINKEGTIEKSKSSVLPKKTSYSINLKSVLDSATIKMLSSGSSQEKSINESIKSIQESIKKSLSVSVSETKRSSQSQSSKSSSVTSSGVSSVTSSEQISKSSSESRNKRSSTSNSKSGSSVLSGEEIKTINKPFIPTQRRESSITKRTLGMGYYAYGKVIKTNKFAKINNNPVTKERAKDIGSYYVSNTLARSFKIVKANKPAIEDYEFNFVPVGYYNSVIKQIREFKIKKGKPTEVGQIFIQKNPFILNTKAERKQLEAFRKQVEQITR